MYNGMNTYRALVTYSSSNDGEILVKIPSILGDANTLSISFLNRTAGSNGMWEVPTVGSQVLVAVEDDRFSNVFLLSWADPDRTVIHGGNTGDILVKASSTDYDTAWTDAPTVDALNFDMVNPDARAVGRLTWNDTDGTLDLGLKGGNVTLQVGQEEVTLVKHADNSGLIEGKAVYLVGSDGNNITVRYAKADVEPSSSKTFGVMTENAVGGAKAYCTTFGLVRDINTSALTEGEIVWLSATEDGGLTTTKPLSPNHLVTVGLCVRQHAHNGVLFVNATNGYELYEIHDVKYTGLATGDLLTRTSSNLWENITRASLASSINSAIDHGTLSGLSDDDHSQYHTDTRGDARYLKLTGGTVNGVTAFQSNLNVGGNASVNGTLITSGAASAGSTLFVGGATTLNSTLTHGGVTHLPHSTGTQPVSPVAGQTWWDSTKKRLWCYNGSAWQIIGGDMPRWDLHYSATWTNVLDSTARSLEWDSVPDEDTDSFHSSTNAYITIPSGLGGLYQLSYFITSPAMGSDYVNQMWLDVNVAATSLPANNTGRRYAASAWSAPVTSVFNGGDVIKLAAGDVVRVKIFQASGSTQTYGIASRRDLNAFRGAMLHHVP